MIESVIAEEDREPAKKKLFSELCQRIYLIESSIGENSSRGIIADIKEEIARRSSDILEADL
jgi:hypothetical protein